MEIPESAIHASPAGYAACLALYKAPGQWFDRLIRVRTNSKYSHCELVVRGVDWYSSLNHVGVDKNERSNFEAWDFIPLLDVDSEQIEAFYEGVKDSLYNYFGATTGILLNLPVRFPGRMHCGEFCAAAIRLPHPVMFSPQSLGERVAARYFAFKSQPVIESGEDGESDVLGLTAMA